MSNDGNFVGELRNRVELIRPIVNLNGKHHTRGVRFKDTNYAVDAIGGALIVYRNRMAGLVMKEVMGLNFDTIQVLDGKFDPLICTVLQQLASIDFVEENRLDRQ